jgi:hypothetical protein
MPRSSVASRWSAYERRTGRGLAPTSLASPLSPITYPATLLRSLVEIAPGVDPSSDPSTWSWVDITQWVRQDLGISTVFGRRDQAGTVDPSRATLKLDNRDGRFSRRNPTGPYYGQLTRSTPIRMAVDPGDGMHYRYHGFVNEWPKRWDKSGNDSTVTIQCGGILRRLQRMQPLRSALYRSIAGLAEGDYIPHAYWPMEDGESATQFAAGLIGGPVGRFDGTVSPGTGSTPVGSAPLAVFGLNARALLPVPAYTNTGQWVFQWIVNIPASPAADPQLLAEFPTPGGTVVRWTLTLEDENPSPDAIYIRGYNSSGSLVASGGTAVNAGDLGDSSDFYGHTFMFTVAALQDGGDVLCWFEGHREDGLQMERTFADTAGTHSGLFGTIKLTSPIADTVMGHGVIFTDPNFSAVYAASDAAENAAAMDGHAGELAHVRMQRIAREERLSFTTSAITSAALGPQPAGTLLEVFRDAERADLGVLYEREWGLGYQALSERYSLPVLLPLDFDSGHVNDPPEADDSDLRFRNQWTVAREGGSEYTVLADDYSDADGLLAGQTTVNAYRDDQLQHIAGWLVHRDTADEDYWTGLKLSFARTPDIIPAWTGLPFGARLNVANPPSQADPGDIDAIVEGWSERWDTVQWTATLNTSPASVLEVPVWDDPGFLWDSGSSSLTSDIAAGDTSISVTTTNPDDLWVTGTVAFDIGIGGEQISVTDISGATSPQTFTVVRAVNGISKAHSAGDAVRLWTDQTWGLT